MRASPPSPAPAARSSNRARPSRPTGSPGRGRAARWLARAALAGLLATVPSATPAGDPTAANPELLGKAKLERLDGGKLRLAELRGKPVLLDLWATWCLPCREQARVLAELAPELAARGVEVLAVDQGEKPLVVQAFLAEHPHAFEVVLDRGQVVSRLLDVGALPALALLAADGSVIEVREELARREDVLALLDRAGVGAGP